MGSKPKVPSYKPPAAAPERQVAVEPEDIQLGDTESQDTTKRGKRSLMRPSGSGSATGLSV